MGFFKDIFGGEKAPEAEAPETPQAEQPAQESEGAEVIQLDEKRAETAAKEEAELEGAREELAATGTDSRAPRGRSPKAQAAFDRARTPQKPPSPFGG